MAESQNLGVAGQPGLLSVDEPLITAIRYGTFASGGESALWQPTVRRELGLEWPYEDNPVNVVTGWLAPGITAGELEAGTEEVHGGADLGADAAGRDPAGPPGEARHAHAAFPGAPLPLPEQAGGAAVQLLGEPGAVVAREDDQRVAGEIEPPQRGEDLPDAPVELLDNVAVQARCALAAEALRGVERHRHSRQPPELALSLARTAGTPQRIVPDEPRAHRPQRRVGFARQPTEREQPLLCRMQIADLSQHAQVCGTGHRAHKWVGM